MTNLLALEQQINQASNPYSKVELLKIYYRKLWDLEKPEIVKKIPAAKKGIDTYRFAIKERILEQIREIPWGEENLPLPEDPHMRVMVRILVALEQSELHGVVESVS